jgi:glycosyltransferase involved in cell wall biosynthesis
MRKEEMKITLVTDTWLPSINGVVTTLTNTVEILRSWGHTVQVIEPSQFKTVGAPGYKEVRLSWDIWRVGLMIEQFRPDAIHIATEGPLGLAARWYCKVEKRSIPHNTSYHTKFPEYFHKMFRVPEDWGYYCMRIFHKFSTRVLVTNQDMADDLTARGFQNLAVWNRGVDRELFNPDKRKRMSYRSPIILCVSRASKEKGLEDFCELKVRGTKILVGDGPLLPELKRQYPNVIYIGFKQGDELAHFYAAADVFVFPSKTDTFGVVMLEAIASGTPVAAYPVTGPRDVVINGVNGFTSYDLNYAVEQALGCDRSRVRKDSERYDWAECTQTFLDNLTVIS